MPSLKDLKNRIASVKATQKITKAMQMVAAAKLRRAQEAAEVARPYAQRVAQVLSNIAANTSPENAPPLLAGTGSDKVHLLVVCTAERGLCGAFNGQIVRNAREHIRTLQAEGKTVKIIAVGKKGADALKRDYNALIIDRVDLRAVKSIGFDQAEMIAAKLFKLYAEGQYDVATLFFSEFRSVIAQIPQARRIIPIDASAGASAAGAIYEYEPGEEQILDGLLPRSIAIAVYSALLENAASEQGARMSAMDSATRNAGDMINRLTLQYNRSRQAMITKELIEIISGAEAL